MSTKRQASLWQLLCWTYAHQRAHIHLRDGYMWFLWAIAQSGADPDGPRPTVARDAARIHEAVCELHPRFADLIVEAAAHCAQPEPPVALPEPDPVPVSRLDSYRDARRGQGYRAGQSVSYVIATADTVAVEEPVYERRHRGKRVKIGTELVSRPVEYCPIDWRPDPVWYASEAAFHRDWLAAMRQLEAAVPAINRDLARHEIVGHGITHPDPAPFEMARDPGIDALARGYAAGRIDVDLSDGDWSMDEPLAPDSAVLVVRASTARRAVR